MPLHEYECQKCGNLQEYLTTKISDGDWVNYMLCTECGGSCRKVMSAPHFRVTGANAINGYTSVPTYDEVIDENGRERKQWGK